MRKSVTKNRLGKYKGVFSLSVVKIVLLLALLFLVVTSCDKDGAVNEKFVVTFGVDSGDGELKATIGEKILISPVEVEKGRKVLFTATHPKSSKIKYWKVNGVFIESLEPEQSFEINRNFDVRVAFEPISEDEVLGKQ